MKKIVETPTDPELLTVKEAAVFLRTTTAAVYAALERGQLPGVVRLGRRILFRTIDLRRHVGLSTEQPSSHPPKKAA